MLNDDTSIMSNVFFDILEKNIENTSSIFKINNSWSHILLDRYEVNKVGWMDEKFLGVGEEDGDFEWRYQNILGKSITNIFIPDINNHVDKEDFSKNMKIVNNKYSAFNKSYSCSKYLEDNINGKNYGIMGKKLVCLQEEINHYPSEKFYWDNKNNL
jgi:predicted glycosyltransferase involved in capsule biosynthesis